MTYNKGKFITTYDFNKIHVTTLLNIFTNDGCAEFENREIDIEDIDELGIDWRICDELVDMGILQEDEESFTIYYEFTEEGKKFFETNMDKFRKEFATLI